MSGVARNFRVDTVGDHGRAGLELDSSRGCRLRCPHPRSSAGARTRPSRQQFIQHPETFRIEPSGPVAEDVEHALGATADDVQEVVALKRGIAGCSVKPLSATDLPARQGRAGSLRARRSPHRLRGAAGHDDAQCASARSDGSVTLTPPRTELPESRLSGISANQPGVSSKTLLVSEAPSHRKAVFRCRCRQAIGQVFPVPLKPILLKLSPSIALVRCATASFSNSK